MRHRAALIVGAIAIGAIPGCGGQPGRPAGPIHPAGVNGRPAAGIVQERRLDLRLDALAEPRPVRTVSGRNPFRFDSFDGFDGFGPDGVPPPARRVPEAGREGPRPAAAERPPRLRFIGVVDAPESAGLIAVLADGADVFQGRVGDTVDGRYRITRIAGDTVEIERLIAGGREVLRLDGLR